MPSDLKPKRPQQNGIRKSSSSPLLSNGHGGSHPPSPTYDSYETAAPVRPTVSRRSTTTFRERDPEILAQQSTRRRYTYAAFFLSLSLISFCVQTETAVYIQRKLNWNKPYCMMYMTHGSWTVLWPFQILILRLQKWNQPFPQFWRRHLQIVRQTALMVKHQTIHLAPHQLQEGNAVFVNYMVRTTAFVTTVLTVAGSSWYVAARLTTPSDLTAIYHCSAFFAYAFSVPMLRERIKPSKVAAVGIAITGVFVMAYGGGSTPKHGSKSGGGAGGPDHEAPEPSGDASYRFLGNIVMGIGSVLYGFYEVLYKKVACPPDDTSPGRGVIFANAFGSMVGAFTLGVLWLPLPILHYLGWEEFQLPRGEQFWMMAISILANVVFSGSFLVLISLTSPVLSSVAALLTIFMVAIIDQLLPASFSNDPLTASTIIGGLLIISAFFLLSWATYKEMTEERKRRYSMSGHISESEDAIDDEDEE